MASTFCKNLHSFAYSQLRRKRWIEHSKMQFFLNLRKFFNNLILAHVLLLPVNNVPVNGANLLQFGLPPCCYAGPPLLQYLHSREADPDVTGQSEVISLEYDNLTEASSSKIQTYLFPMDVKSKLKRTVDDSVNITKPAPDATETGSAHAQTGFSRSENDLDAHENTTLRHMPSDWKGKLRRVLFKSFKDQINEGLKNRTEILWEKIYEAPFQVVAATTRQEIPIEQALTSLEYVSVPNERIAGVMVNTETGIELRTSESTDTGVAGSTDTGLAESVQPISTACDCHLIHHGDTLLAYWSVGFSGNSLEYLIYPLPHNVPTPPIFESFHPDPIRPSPVDLTPLISSRSIDDIPFQPSLEFGTAAASQHASYPTNGIQHIGNAYPQNGYGVPSGKGIGTENVPRNGFLRNDFPPGLGAAVVGNGFPVNENGPLGNGIGFPGNGFPNGNNFPNVGSGFPENGNGFPYGNPGFPMGGIAPFLGFGQLNRLQDPQQFNPGFGGYPPEYPAIMYMPPQPTPHRKEDGGPGNFRDPRGQNNLEGNGIGPLDPFNPVHPKSIQEILFGNPVNGNFMPLRDFPPLRPDEGYEGELPPGPNPGVYLPEYDQYPRRGQGRDQGQRGQGQGDVIPPRSQVIRSRPPGIYVNDVGGRRPDDRGKPGDFNYNDKGISDRPIYPNDRDRDDCYKNKNSNNCLRRYGGDYGTKNRGRSTTYYQSSSTNTKNKVRDGRKPKTTKSEEGSYVLDF